MTYQDAPASEEIAAEWSETPPSVKSIMPGFNAVLKINYRVRGLILDYTLMAAILGLMLTYSREWISGKWFDVVDILSLGLLNLKMIRAIGASWGNPKGQGAFAVASSLLGVLGAFAIAIMARLIVSIVGLFIPLIIILSRAVGHATLTWALGRAANQFFLSTKRVNLSTLKQAIQSHQRDQNKSARGKS
ncbi:MAG: hypothetical protein QNJ46_34940 [Leptolyngbyaceae cyanobacterium MO_188.B28]|nr:hypothetical protein [Leptolyngbyaceae cyanobacterium MO_188.B28]